MVFMLATAADPWSPDTWVQRRRKGHSGQWDVPTTPIHLMYQEFMCGVDVTDQLRASYPSLMRSHKWWHKCVSIVVDPSLVNAKILHDEAVLDMGFPIVTTKQFRLRVAEELVKGSMKPHLLRPPHRLQESHSSSKHYPERSTRRRMCVLCGRKQNYYCAGCNYEFLCFLHGNCYCVRKTCKIVNSVISHMCRMLLVNWSFTFCRPCAEAGSTAHSRSKRRCSR